MTVGELLKELKGLNEKLEVRIRTVYQTPGRVELVEAKPDTAWLVNTDQDAYVSIERKQYERKNYSFD